MMSSQYCIVVSHSSILRRNVNPTLLMLSFILSIHGIHVVLVCLCCFLKILHVKHCAEFNQLTRSARMS